jgi:hypothetical protein
MRKNLAGTLVEDPLLMRPTSRGIIGAVVADYLLFGPPLTLPAVPVLVGPSDPVLAVGDSPSALAGVMLAVGLLTGFQSEPMATWFPTIGLFRFPSLEGRFPALAKVFEVRMLMSLLSSGILIVSDAAGAVQMLAGATLASWMVPTDKLSWNGNATFGLTCFFLVGLDWLSCNRDQIQFCCSNSAMADISD